MGLAERFKDKLNKKDIFSKDNNENFVSKPIQKNPNIQTSSRISSHSSELIKNNYKNFEDLESEIIEKIRKTPYWEEYSKIRQEKMISAYFDKKISSENYSHLKHSSPDNKFDFIQNILTLANNR